MLGDRWSTSSLIMVAACAVPGCTLPRPQEPGTLESPSGGQCMVSVRNASIYTLDVTYRIISTDGAERVNEALGPVQSGVTRLITAYCGEMVEARGSANGRTARGNARAGDRGTEIVLRMGASDATRLEPAGRS